MKIIKIMWKCWKYLSRSQGQTFDLWLYWTICRWIILSDQKGYDQMQWSSWCRWKYNAIKVGQNRGIIEASAKVFVSSAYWRSGTTRLEEPTLNPKKSCSWTTLKNNPLRPSATRRKRKGVRGSPCFNPISILISWVEQLLTKTSKLP